MIRGASRVRRATAWPLPVSLLVLWLTLGTLLILCLRANGGRLVYALDDPYIHMTIARNLAEHGDWGFGPELFTSASSSPLWVLVLAGADLIFGAREWLPFALNLLFASLLLALLDSRLRCRHPAFRLGALLVLAFGAPMPALVFGGMEHTLHALIAVLWLHAALAALSKEGGGAGRALPALSLLLVGARYEGFFVLLPAAFLFARQRRFQPALAILGAGLLPVILYAVFSLSQGGAWLPDPILLKGKGIDLHSLGAWLHSIWSPLRYQLRSPLSPFIVHLLSLLLVGILLLWARRGSVTPRDWGQAGLAILLTAIIAQFLFAGVGWFFRYEAWLVVLGIFVLAEILPAWPWSSGVRHLWGHWWAPIAVVLLVLGVALAARGGVSFSRIRRATHNIYSQQYQMGLFLREYYTDASVAANDVGAINYLAPIQCLDLVGHSNRDVGRARRAGIFDKKAMAAFAERAGVRIALVYVIWFDGKLPAQWRKVGEWTIPQNVVCGGDTVTFFACKPGEVESLRAHLEAYKPRLPDGVTTRLLP